MRTLPRDSCSWETADPAYIKAEAEAKASAQARARAEAPLQAVLEFNPYEGHSLVFPDRHDHAVIAEALSQATSIEIAVLHDSPLVAGVAFRLAPGSDWHLSIWSWRGPESQLMISPKPQVDFRGFEPSRCAVSLAGNEAEPPMRRVFRLDQHLSWRLNQSVIAMEDAYFKTEWFENLQEGILTHYGADPSRLVRVATYSGAGVAIE